MLRYILQRIIIAIPTLLFISLAVFGLSKCAPGDPVENVFGEAIASTEAPAVIAERYRQKAARIGIDKPLFYGSISIAAFPDTLWKIYPLDRRDWLSRLTAQNGNWPATRALETAIQQSLLTADRLPDSLRQKQYLRLALLQLSTQNNLEKLEQGFQNADNICREIKPPIPGLNSSMDTLRARTATACNALLPSKLVTPTFHWYGLNNQYHHWLTGFLTGNWGLTMKQLPVWQELKPALFASMAINLLAIFFAYLIAIPLGVEIARRKGRTLDRWVQRALIFLHAMPVFWVGGLLVMLFCSPIWGKPLIANPYLDISDAWNMNSEPFLTWFSSKSAKFTLPILVLTLYALASITLQMRGGMLETLGLDYIRTARAKGVKEDEVFWTHAFRNALFPVITIFASVFPALFTGSLVIETLFNFPGMGQKAQTAFQEHDLAILSAILMAAAIFTILGNLVADILYAVADPRVRFVSEK